MKADQGPVNGQSRTNVLAGDDQEPGTLTDSPTRSTGFPYPPLPSNDGLRVLNLLPGDFWDPLTGKLESVPFSAKPRYIALSYTWADPDPDYARIPSMPREEPVSVAIPATDSDTGDEAALPVNKAKRPHININAASLPLFHNLSLALRFLRSPTHSLPLWVDAICVDQANMDERNAQVALMAFIFKRAAGVISWLGVPNLEGRPARRGSAFGRRNERSDLRMLWETRTSHHIAGRFADKAVGPDLFNFVKDSMPPLHFDERNNDGNPLPVLRKIAAGDRMLRVHDNPYWSRLWVIQEVCLPSNLAFVFGGEVWPEALLRQILVAAETISGRVLVAQQPAEMTMGKLLAARKERFTDAMRLESLIERFMRSGCAELRDRVFGLVGLANDVDSFALDIMHPQHRLLTEDSAQGRGRGSLQIDYTRSFYDIWRDVVSYMYFRAKPMLDFGKETTGMEDERRIRVVRFAGVVQMAFEGKLEEKVPRMSKPLQGAVRKADLVSSAATKGRSHGTRPFRAGVGTPIPMSVAHPPERQMIQAKGYVAGTVVHIGPTYGEFVGSYLQQQRWLASWDTHYPEARDLEKLRQMEESYSAKIIDYSDTAIARIRHINNEDTVCWSVLGGVPPITEFPGFFPHLNDDSEPVRFLGSDFCMGLAPAGVHVGDLVIRFWNCDAAVIVRRGKGTYASWHGLVGRADVAEPHGQRRDGMDNTAKDAMRIFGGDGAAGSAGAGVDRVLLKPRQGRSSSPDASGGPRTKAMYIRLDFETLQLISSGIAI